MANRLTDEQSPYLLQHAHNPVNWYAWGDEPFERAKSENKPVLVSIGYAACHWCHVMERESFENEAVAAYMNEHFINVKVDREEHPDVDHFFMDAVQAISGSGGWPLNVFVTPDRIPFYGGTYFPPRPMYNRMSWMQLLERMNDVWQNKPEEVKMQTDQMLHYLQQASKPAGIAKEGAECTMDACKQMAAALLQQADTEYGGFGRAPKFPGTMAISFLLEHYHFTKDTAAREHALFSLEAMVKGGIYDQLGGGFARYSTDDQWLAPHFEKMLYDNALLVISLCDAWSLTKKPVFRDAIKETIAFAERELKEPSGGYYSAIDADSEGVEGKFYTWTWDEWKEVTGEDNALLSEYFGVTEDGNWEHTNILHIAKDIPALAAPYGLKEEDILERIAKAKENLFAARERRVRPITDDKSLLSWNALMNIALSKAGTVLPHRPYLKRAEEHMEWMLENFHSDGVLQHSWKNGKARISANLDDYAYLMQALLQLAAATGENEWILKAMELTEIVIKEFVHEDGSFFYYTAAQQRDIPVRKVELYDGATPSSNAVMAHNLLLLGLCAERNDWLEQSSYMLSQMAQTAMRYPYSFCYWGMMIQRCAAEPKLIVCTGEDCDRIAMEIRQNFIPQGYVITAKKEIGALPAIHAKISAKQNQVFVCTQYACLPPAADAGDALALIGNIK